MVTLLQKKRGPHSMLGLCLHNNRIEGAVVQRTNGSVTVQQQFETELSLNPLSADPQLVGREIRNHLEKAGIRERRCVVGLPLSWALLLQTKLPDLPEADLQSFLEIEAERGFPYAIESLWISHARFVMPGGQATATTAAVPRSHIAHIEAALRHARLQPVSLTLAMAGIFARASKAEGGITLSVWANQIELAAECRGGLAALRVLEGVVEHEGASSQIAPSALVRELRITLGQIPEDCRAELRRIRVVGRKEDQERVVRAMGDVRSSMGLPVETAPASRNGALHLPAAAEMSPALGLAANHLMGDPAPFEFLPPRVSKWQQLSTRFTSKKLGSAGMVAGGVAAIVIVAFLIQQWQLSSLERRWAAIAVEVRDLDGMQQQIRKYRPWYDQNFNTLTLLKQLTSAFPEDGRVTAKRVEVRGGSIVTCTGTARDSQAVFEVLDLLRADSHVSDVNVEQLRGKAPVQFTFKFRWSGGPQS